MHEEGISVQSPGLPGRGPSALTLLVGLMLPLMQSGRTQLPLEADPQTLLFLTSLAAFC